MVAVTTPRDPPKTAGWTIGPEPAVVPGESGDEPIDFFIVYDAARLPSGRIVVFDGGTKELHYFEPTGDWIATAGGEGDGPGEFRAPMGVAVLGTDTVLVLDQAHQRLSLFDGDGNLLEDRRLEDPPTGRTPWAPLPFGVYEAASAINDTVLLTGAGFIPIAGELDQVLENPNLQYLVDGTYLGAVGEPQRLRLHASSGGEPRLFSTAQGTAARHGKIYVRDAEAYEIRVYASSGELQTVHRLARPRRAATEQDVARYRNWLTSRIEDPERRRRMLESVDRRERVDSFPALSEVWPDAVGDVWVREYRPQWEEDAPTAVFSADGPWLGTVDLPADFRPLDIGRDYVLGVHIDALDVQHVHLYDLRR